MKYTTTVLFALVLTASAGVAASKEKKAIFFAEKPSNEEAYAKIKQYLGATLIDPYSAHMSCSEVSEKAWVWPGIGFGKHYGYLVFCDVNAKNRLGGYTGGKRFVFRFNGPEFEYEEITPRMGLYKEK